MTEPDYDDIITNSIFRNSPTTPERAKVIQANAVAEIVISVHQKLWPGEYADLSLSYGIADALWQAGLRFPDASLPLDPEPWVIHSSDRGNIRVPPGRPVLGYRHNFEPREGYNTDRSRYQEVNDGRG